MRAWLGRSGHHDSLQAVDRQMLLLLTGGQVADMELGHMCRGVQIELFTARVQCYFSYGINFSYSFS